MHLKDFNAKQSKNILNDAIHDLKMIYAAQ